MVQRQAPSLNGAHPERLEVPPIRLAAPGGGGGGCRWRRATGRTKARKDKPFTIMHWNAESVMNKTTELEHVILHEENINICCIQETHLQSNKYCKVGGLSVLQVRQNRPKQRRSTDSCQKQH